MMHIYTYKQLAPQTIRNALKEQRCRSVCERASEMVGDEKDLIISARLGQSLTPAVVCSQPLPAHIVNDLSISLTLSFSLSSSWPAAADGRVQPWPPHPTPDLWDLMHLSHTHLCYTYNIHTPPEHHCADASHTRKHFKTITHATRWGAHTCYAMPR